MSAPWCNNVSTAPPAGIMTLEAGACCFALLWAHISAVDFGGGGGDLIKIQTNANQR